MSAGRELLAQQRDQALADLVDLERQLAEGEIPDEAATRLRRRYEATAARAIEALDVQPDEEPAAAPPSRPARRARARPAAYLVAGATVMVAALVLLPQYVAERPDGGAVTGNEAVQPPVGASASPAPPRRDLSTVTAAEMERVLAANPEVLGMRLALAERYVEQAQYDKAAEHYGLALEQAPNNPTVRAGAAWLLFKTGDTDAALRFLDETLNIAPASPDVLWSKARILLDGRRDPRGALDILQRLAARSDLSPERRAEVDQLTARAQEAASR
ncbi:tetratricopeptide repeat protein [Amycolatopsis aidingensis]|uniref:tetratricopeptide repeat protein n=1 Tax=Amycolatopsis aidingensis TaxID=2842453 RepID=UPI001C0C1FF2|nr:tetratricopeptide repeat protein [Amycolatopsis aidingensis]